MNRKCCGSRLCWWDSSRVALRTTSPPTSPPRSSTRHWRRRTSCKWWPPELSSGLESCHPVSKGGKKKHHRNRIIDLVIKTRRDKTYRKSFKRRYEVEVSLPLWQQQTIKVQHGAQLRCVSSSEASKHSHCDLFWSHGTETSCSAAANSHSGVKSVLIWCPFSFLPSFLSLSLPPSLNESSLWLQNEVGCSSGSSAAGRNTQQYAPLCCTITSCRHMLMAN